MNLLKKIREAYSLGRELGMDDLFLLDERRKMMGGPIYEETCFNVIVKRIEASKKLENSTILENVVCSIGRSFYRFSKY